MRIGDLRSGFDYAKVKEMLNIAQLTEEECKNCWAINLCTFCQKTADGYYQLSSEKRLNYCLKSKHAFEHNLKNYLLLDVIFNRNMQVIL